MKAFPGSKAGKVDELDHIPKVSYLHLVYIHIQMRQL